MTVIGYGYGCCGEHIGAPETELLLERPIVKIVFILSKLFDRVNNNIWQASNNTTRPFSAAIEKCFNSGTVI